MAVTSTYSFTQILPKTQVPSFGGTAASNTDTVGLSGGGWATSVTDTSGFSDITFYNSVGAVVGSNFSFGSAGGRLAQLTKGNIVAVGTPSAGGVNFAIDTATGGGVTSGSISTSTSETQADVAALTGGGFVVVDQRSFSAPDNDIEVFVRDSSGGAVSSFSVDSSGADDEHASVAGLKDGGFAVAWDRTDTNGNSSLWYAIYNSDGSTRLAATQLDSFGTINAHPNVTALASGGFTIAYQDNGWDTSTPSPDITLATLDSAGSFQNYIRASSLTSDDSDASVTTLSNGLLLSTFTNNFNNGGDLDIRALLSDSTGTTLTSASAPISIDFTSDHTFGSSVSAYGLAQFAVSYTNSTNTAVDVQAYQLVRTGTGTSGADVFTGDDAINNINGGAGNDVLKGGRNGDTLFGSTGNDKLFGEAGNDVLIGGVGDDVLNGSSGSDTARYQTNAAVTVNLSLTGAQNTIGDGVDTLTSIENVTGGNGNDTLIGNATANRIIGGVGNDTITGGAGGDYLNGNGGADTFVYTALSDSGLSGSLRDKILDFQVGTDKVDLSAIDANSVAGGNQAFSFIGTAGFSGVAGQLDVIHVGASTYVQGDVNGDKVRDFQIAFSGNLSLAATDFSL